MEYGFFFEVCYTLQWSIGGKYKVKIFVAEDEAEIRRELSVLLQKYGYACESSTDFAHLTDHILKAEADLVLLDINLPCRDGYTICREIREKSDIPIIVLTSRNTDLDELMSLNIGAADYLETKRGLGYRV